MLVLQIGAFSKGERQAAVKTVSPHFLMIVTFASVRAAVTARKDDAPAAVQAAIVNVAGLGSCSVGGGLIQTTSG